MNAPDIIWRAERRRYHLHRRLKFAFLVALAVAVIYCTLARLGVL